MTPELGSSTASLHTCSSSVPNSPCAVVAGAEQFSLPHTPDAPAVLHVGSRDCRGGSGSGGAGSTSDPSSVVPCKGLTATSTPLNTAPTAMELVSPPSPPAVLPSSKAPTTVSVQQNSSMLQQHLRRCLNTQPASSGIPRTSTTQQPLNLKVSSAAPSDQPEIAMVWPLCLLLDQPTRMSVQVASPCEDAVNNVLPSGASASELPSSTSATVSHVRVMVDSTPLAELSWCPVAKSVEGCVPAAPHTNLALRQGHAGHLGVASAFPLQCASNSLAAAANTLMASATSTGPAVSLLFVSSAVCSELHTLFASLVDRRVHEGLTGSSTGCEYQTYPRLPDRVSHDKYRGAHNTIARGCT
jgi:hypothetical protein